MKKGKRKKAELKILTEANDASGGQGYIRHLFPAVFLACTTFLAYVVALKGTWAFDDTAIGQYASIKNALTLHLGYRKIAYLSFLVNRLIDPVSPVNYRVTNILIHICNALLVYAVAWKTLRLPAWKEKYGEYAFSAAFLSATIFALHPININAVSYIVQRMTSLAAMFALLALLSYLSGRTSRYTARAAVLYALSGICVLLGIFSKENAVMAIPLIVLYDFVFLRVSGIRKFFVKTAAAVMAGLLILAAASFILEFQKAAGGLLGAFLHPFSPITAQNWTATDVYWTPLQHVLTEFRIVTRYLFLLVLPLPKFLVFDWWGFPVSRGIIEPATTITSLFFIAGLVAFSIWKRRELPFLSFGLLWYFIALSLESFVALGSDLYFEHRNYLPLAGLAIGVTAQAVVSLSGGTPRKKNVWLAACAFALVLGGLTFQRNLVWKDSVTLWQDSVDKTKGNLRAMIALGNARLRVSNLSEAKKWYRDAAEVSAADKRTEYLHDSLYSLGMVDLFTGDLAGAAKVIEVMNRELEGSYVSGIIQGLYLSVSGDYNGALRQFESILPSAEGFDRVVLYTLIGDTCAKQGLPARAIENYNEAVRLDPSFAAAYYGLGTTYLGMKDLNRAEQYIGTSLTIDPLNCLALADMADILLIRKEPPEKAERLAVRAIAQSPVQYSPYLTMGNVLIVMGKEEEAEGYYLKAREHGAKDYLVPFSKARAYYLKGDNDKVAFYMKEVLSMKDTPEKIRQSLAGRR